MNWPVGLRTLVILVPLLGCQAAAESVWTSGPGYRSLEVVPSGSGKAGFTLLKPEATGIWFTNVLEGDAYSTNAVAHNGAGVAIGDVDGDGWADIYLCSLQGRNRLYRNLGNWHFEELDAGPAACAGQFSTGATFADVDGDGDLDLLVNGIAAGTRLFLNDGHGRFTEATDSGLSRTASATSLALADIDGDGDLDLYCTHYIDEMHLFDPTTRFSVIKRDGRWIVLKVNDQPTTLPRLKDRFEALPDGRVRELPEVHGLYRNDGHGHFTAIQFEPGVFSDEQGRPIPPFRDWGLSAMFRDLNGDGAPDLYVCNDNVSPDRIWMNSGKGTFRLVDPLSFRHTSRSSMGVDFADVNRDGYDDLMVVDMLAREHHTRMTQLVKDLPEALEREQLDARPQYNRNTLFLGRPDGTYTEAALLAGVAATDWSWCPIFLDVDLDGYEDLLISNGFEADVMDQDSKDALRNPQHHRTRNELKHVMDFYPRWRSARVAFHNRGDGTFESASQAWGFDQVGVSHGMALGDLDNDGDLDVVVNNLNGLAGVYRNDSGAARIGVRLKGSPPNTQGIGARIALVGASLTQNQEMICGGRYLSGDQPMRVFAAGPASVKPVRLEVTWRNGSQTTITNPHANCIYEVDQAAATAGPHSTNRSAPIKPAFKEVSDWIGHVHTEASFDDWAQQPSLPRRLSRLGPGVSWCDLDNDGWEDLIVTAAKGGKPGLFRNQQGQGFQPWEGAEAQADQGAVVGWMDSEGKRRLFVAVSSFQMKPGAESELLDFSLTNRANPLHLPVGKASLGPLALADIDGDGDLDLFIGGRFSPGRYPEPVASAIWINDQGTFKPSAATSRPFEAVGLVSGATFADLDGDGWPDLALAPEWGPVRVFRNNHGTFEDVTATWGFTGRSGWWTGIAAGDFDGDGRLDLAVGNWGRNSSYELNGEANRGLFYGDWNSDGRITMIEGWQEAAKWFPVHNRAWLASACPELASHFPTHQAFAQATVADILGSRYSSAKMLQANEFRSGVFLNRGSHFEWVPLPMDAQLSPVLSIQVGDFDGDGIEDLFLSQNFFSSPPETVSQEAITRDDGGRGLWLRGSGHGTFTAVDGSLTGVKVYGEQRGAALADFNHDGRVDLVVSQNNGATKLFLNETAKAGLRVILRGPTGNPDAVSAQMRVRYANGLLGPCRSISAGTGYWSQDAATQVLGCSETPQALWIRWPGGKEQIVPIDNNSREIIVRYSSN